MFRAVAADRGFVDGAKASEPDMDAANAVAATQACRAFRCVVYVIVIVLVPRRETQIVVWFE